MITLSGATMFLGLSVALVVITIVHEFGHMIAACLLDIPIKRITVGLGPVMWRRQFSIKANEVELVLRPVPLGMAIGVPSRRGADGQLRRPVVHDMLVAMAGPTFSMLLATGLHSLAQYPQLGLEPQVWLYATAILSALVGVLNLIPLPGLDGGHLAILAAARLGWQLTPQQELSIHQIGLRLLALLTLGLLIVQVSAVA